MEGNRNIGKGARRMKVVIVCILSFMAIFQFFPLFWLTDFSLSTSGMVNSGRILVWPSPFQWINYVDAWNRGHIPSYLLNSVIVTGGSIVLTLFAAATASYAFTRMRWKLNKLVYVLSIIGMMIPLHATLLPNYIVCNQLGLINTYFALIINYSARSIPFAIMVMCAFLESVPFSLEESAVIDGAGIYRIIFSIILPLTMSAMMTVGISQFMGAWNDFIMALTFITKDTLRTLPFSVQQFKAVYGADYAKQFAVMVISTIPMIVIYIAFNERITKGIMLGAVKA